MKDKLLTKILATNDTDKTIINSAELATRISEVQKAVAKPELKKAIDEIRTKTIEFKPDELAEIKTKRLYLSLPEPNRTKLYELAVPEVERGLEKEELPIPSRDVEVASKDDKFTQTLAYLALKYEDSYSFNNLGNLLPKFKAIFGSEQSLEEYIDNYHAAFPKDKNVIGTAYKAVKWSKEGLVLSRGWDKILAADKTRLAGKLIYHAADIEAANGEKVPANLDETLDLFIKAKFKTVLDKIDSLDESKLLNGLTKNKLKQFVKDYVVEHLSGHKYSSYDKGMETAMMKSIDILSSSTAKTKETDQMPEINIDAKQASAQNRAEAEKTKAVLRELGKLTPEMETRIDSETSAFEGSLSKYYIRKLPAGDPRGLYLGHLTNCCQSMDGDGKEAAKYGMRESDGGFYVICERNGKEPNLSKDKIVAQSFAWLGDTAGKSIVFDSFEPLGDEHKKLFEPFYLAARDSLKAGGYSYVGCGSSGRVKIEAERAASRVEMKVKDGYKYAIEGYIYSDGAVQYDLSTYRNKSILLKLREIGALSNEADLDLILSNKEVGEINLNNEAKAILDAGDLDLFFMTAKKIGPEALSLKNSTGETALYLAIKNNDQELAFKLIKHMNPGDLNLVDAYGDTALILAAKDGHTDIVKALIAAGADLHKKTVEGWGCFKALDWAIISEHKDVVEILIAAGADTRGALNLAVNNKDMVSMLLKMKPELINSKDRNDRTALISAAYAGNKEVVEILIAAGADLDAKDSGDTTAFDGAKCSNNSEILSILIIARATKNFLTSNKALTPPELMAKILEAENKMPIDKSLIANYLNEKDIRGVTNFSKIIKSGNKELVEAALRYTPDLKLASKAGTPEEIARKYVKNPVILDSVRNALQSAEVTAAGSPTVVSIKAHETIKR